MSSAAGPAYTMPCVDDPATEHIGYFSGQPVALGSALIPNAASGAAISSSIRFRRFILGRSPLGVKNVILTLE